MDKAKKRLWRTIAKTCKQMPRGNATGIDWTINERVAVKAMLDGADTGGMVCLVSSGMDCDHATWLYGDIVPTPTVTAFMRQHAAYMAGAEGPQGMYAVPPTECPESESRDLILEAFEDGHPHVVYY